MLSYQEFLDCIRKGKHKLRDRYDGGPPQRVIDFETPTGQFCALLTKTGVHPNGCRRTSWEWVIYRGHETHRRCFAEDPMMEVSHIDLFPIRAYAS